MCHGMSENYSKRGEENRLDQHVCCFYIDISLETTSVCECVAMWRGMSENYSERGEENRLKSTFLLFLDI